MNAKEKIENLLRQTGRKGMEDLLAWMNENGFYDAPCSSKYHLAQPGGLAKHSLNVFTNAVKMAETLFEKLEDQITFETIESLTICALLHDLGKAGQFGKPCYIENSGDDPAYSPYKTNNDLLYIPHEIRSIVIASKFIDLTEQEQFAILYHNGLDGELTGFKGKEDPLLLILHHADMWAARVTEKEDRK